MLQMDLDGVRVMYSLSDANKLFYVNGAQVEEAGYAGLSRGSNTEYGGTLRLLFWPLISQLASPRRSHDVKRFSSRFS